MGEIEFQSEQVTGELADYVSEVWHLCRDSDDTPQMIAPDGCCEIILHRGVPPLEPSNEDWLRQPETILSGPLNRALALHLSGPMDVLGIRLHPWAVGGLGRTPAAWRNRSIPLYSIIGEACAARLLKNAREAAGPAEFLLAADGVLQRLFGTHELPPGTRPLVEALRSGTANSVSDLVDISGLGERTILRRFERACGLPVGDLIGIFRFHRARDAIKQGVALSEVADLAGYSDQAHMTRDFRRFAGTTPVPARDPAVFDVFYEPDRA